MRNRIQKHQYDSMRINRILYNEIVRFYNNRSGSIAVHWIESDFRLT